MRIEREREREKEKGKRQERERERERKRESEKKETHTHHVHAKTHTSACMQAYPRLTSLPASLCLSTSCAHPTTHLLQPTLAITVTIPLSPPPNHHPLSPSPPPSPPSAFLCVVFLYPLSARALSLLMYTRTTMVRHWRRGVVHCPQQKLLVMRFCVHVYVHARVCTHIYIHVNTRTYAPTRAHSLPYANI